MRTALLFQDGNFVGREYLAQLAAAGRAPDLLVAVGRMKPESVAFERARTGGRWDPPPMPDRMPVSRFASLADPALRDLLEREAVDIAIQGGVGILRQPLLGAPRIGFLNVHPGRLPAYRGNSCPEWAVLDGDDVVATAHLIDEGIDTGPVVCARVYAIDPGWDYAEFRARLYAHCGRVLVEALARIEGAAGSGVAAILTPQPQDGACYRPAMPPELLAEVRARFPLAAARRSAGS